MRGFTTAPSERFSRAELVTLPEIQWIARPRQLFNSVKEWRHAQPLQAGQHRFARDARGARHAGRVLQAAAGHSGDWPSDRTTAPTTPAIAAGHTGRLAAELSALYGRGSSDSGFDDGAARYGMQSLGEQQAAAPQADGQSRLNASYFMLRIEYRAPHCGVQSHSRAIQRSLRLAA